VPGLGIVNLKKKVVLGGGFRAEMRGIGSGDFFIRVRKKITGKK
jgi:hypothetical protein